MQVDTTTLFKAVKAGSFDFADSKVEIKEGVIGLVGHEFLFLYLHLSDLYVFQMLKEKRDSFQNYVVKKVLHDMEIKIDDAFIDIYNSRLQEYSTRKRLIADTSKGETPKDTLFWEFGKRISSLVSGSPDHILLVTTTQSLVVHAWANLWSLELLHSK